MVFGVDSLLNFDTTFSVFKKFNVYLASLTSKTMGNKRKKKRTRKREFGKPAGKYSRKARAKKQQRQQKWKNTLDEACKNVSFSIKEQSGLKITFRQQKIDKAKRYITSVKNNESTKVTFHAGTKETFSGNRIINLGNLRTHVTDISVHSALCEKARQLALKGKDPIVVVSEKRNGFTVLLTAKCQGCGQAYTLKNAEDITSAPPSTSGKYSDINIRAVWGNMVTGGGCSTLNESMGTMGIPGMSTRQYSKIENQIGEWWGSVLEEDMRAAGEEERRHAEENNCFFEGIPSVTVVCDGGWCKRSHKHTYNAMSGVGVVFGLHTKKLLHMGIRNKLCYVCNAAERKQQNPREHECFKNWTGSAQSMECDIILDGFLNCERQHGVRYMRFIGDGDSSVYRTITEHVPVWGPHVEKVECANHACKCLRTHLEQLVQDKPVYKGKGKLTQLNRKRIVQGVRTAIKMRSQESDRKSGLSKLKADIINCGKHVLGIHNDCSTDFCKHAIQAKEHNESQGCSEHCEPDDAETDHDIIDDACAMWSETTRELNKDEILSVRKGGNTCTPVSEDLLKDLHFLLNRMSQKAPRLIGNFTSNLAECWMSIRCKFDGGKMTNRGLRGSFMTRCYGGGLRVTRGPAWSPFVYSKVTGQRADPVFVDTYRQRSLKYITTKRRNEKEEVKKDRYKRKLQMNQGCNSKRARLDYGPEVLNDTPDVTDLELQKQCQQYLTSNVECGPNDAEVIELETRGQANNQRWKEERKKRLTSSVFGEVMSRTVKNNSPKLTQRLLYSNFGGNKFTRRGLLEEENTRKEYINLKNKHVTTVSHIIVPGLVISQNYPYLAASSDGIVNMENGEEGLVEIKNLLQNREYLIKEASSKDRSFCLTNKSGQLQLKRSHKYYYQIQGQLNILEKAWCDFVVRRTDPYDIFVERIIRDTELWELHMVPKLKAFYETHVLPELALPRSNSISGIRRPQVPWFNPAAAGKRSARVRVSCQRQPEQQQCTTAAAGSSATTVPQPLVSTSQQQQVTILTTGCKPKMKTPQKKQMITDPENSATTVPQPLVSTSQQRQVTILTTGRKLKMKTPQKKQLISDRGKCLPPVSTCHQDEQLGIQQLLGTTTQVKCLTLPSSPRSEQPKDPHL